MKRKSNKLFIIVTTLLIIGLIYFGLRLYIDKVEEEAKLKAQKENILEGVQLEPHIVEVDYSKKIADGSPLVFGGAHMPLIQHQDAWNKIADSGITSLRRDFFLESEVPSGISLEDYIDNKNNIQDPSTWDQRAIKDRNDKFNSAKKKNMNVIGILSYSPAWLTYSENRNGVPKDWNVYKDIVKKTYRLHRNYIDYIEVWNEPSYDKFLDLSNSPYSREEAYNLIFYYGAKGIREVDEEISDGKKIPIGGLVAHTPFNITLLEELLKDDKSKALLDFISYHNYGHAEPSWNEYSNLLKKYNKNIPFFITEWNYNSSEINPSQYNTGPLAISYTADKLLSYLNSNVIAGANYYLMEPITKPSSEQGDYMGFYRWNNGKATLVPQAVTWKILSKSLALGNGRSIIVDSRYDSDLMTGIGFINNSQIKGAAVVNKTDKPELVEFNLKNGDIKDRANVDIYIASSNSDGAQVIAKRKVYPDSNNLKFRYIIPEYSIIGIKLSEDNKWYDFLIHK